MLGCRVHQAAQREVSAGAASVRPPPQSRGNPLAWLKAALRPALLPNHYASLHGLRVIAIILVVQLHATAALRRFGVIAFSTDSFWFGMDLFFFLSGFLIGSMLLAESRSGQPLNMLRFYLRRSFRIVPPYMVILTLFALFTPDLPERRANLWLEYLYLTNYAPPLPGLVLMPWAWSLAVEEHFYLIVPLLVLTLRSLRTPRAQLGVLVLLWLSALVVRGWAFATGGPWSLDRMMSVIYVQSHLRYDILVAGIFTAYVQHHHGAALAERLRRGMTRHLLAGTAAFFLLLILGTQWLMVPFPAYALLQWGTFTSLAYVPLVLLLLNREGGLTRLLSRRVFLWIATFGYGIYLIHIPVIWGFVLPIGAVVAAWARLPPTLIWLFVICAALVTSTFLGYLIHLLIEKPALRLRDRFSP